MNTQTLSSQLWGFLQDMLTKTYSYKQSGEMPLISRVFVNTIVDQFSYNNGALGYTSHDEYIQKTEWDWRDQLDFTTKAITENNNYKPIVLRISKQYGVNEGQAEYWLQRLIQVIMAKEENKPSDEKIVDYVATFIADLEKTPLNWRIKIWANGFQVNDTTSIQVSEDISIRQITAQDMESERPLDTLRFDTVHQQHASAIIEISKRFKDQTELYNFIETLANALRLFRLGSVAYVKYVLEVDSFINFGGTSGGNSMGTAYSYELQPADKDDLASAVALIFSKNNTAKIFDSQPDVTNPIGIALKRYNNALLKSDTDEERIASVVSCLEALYLKSQERAELSLFPGVFLAKLAWEAARELVDQRILWTRPMMGPLLLPQGKPFVLACVQDVVLAHV